MKNRRRFIRNSALNGITFFFGSSIFSFVAMNPVTPQQFFFEDDGTIPNSKYPLLVYQSAFSLKGDAGANWLEKHFKDNNWFNSWRWGVYPFHHYHSTTHEVLGCFLGNALLHMGVNRVKK